MQRIIAVIRGLAAKHDGQDLLEYGLLAALIAVVAVAAVTTLGVRNSALWQTIVNNF